MDRHNAHLDALATREAIIARTRQSSNILSGNENQPPAKAAQQVKPAPFALGGGEAMPSTSKAAANSSAVSKAYDSHVESALKKHASNRSAPRSTSLW